MTIMVGQRVAKFLSDCSRARDDAHHRNLFLSSEASTRAGTMSLFHYSSTGVEYNASNFNIVLDLVIV
jgi:hypothetical protein